MTDCCAFFFSFLFLSIYRMYSFKFYIFYFLFDIILCMFKVQSRKASVLGLVADLITSYRSRQWGARWGVQHLPMFYCFRPPVCPWVNQNCRVICSLSISWWDHNVSITFVVAGGPASTRSQLWAIFSPLYPTGEQNVLTMPQKWHTLQQPLRENTCPGKQHCCEWETGRHVERVQRVWQAVNGNKCSTLKEQDRQATQTLTEWMNLSLIPAVSAVPAGGTDYKTTAKSSSTDMIEDMSRQKEILSLILSSSLNGHSGHCGLSRLTMEDFGKHSLRLLG